MYGMAAYCLRVLAETVRNDERRQKTGTEGTGLRVSAHVKSVDQCLGSRVCEGKEEDREADKSEGQVVNGRRRGVRG